MNSVDVRVQSNVPCPVCTYSSQQLSDKKVAKYSIESSTTPEMNEECSFPTDKCVVEKGITYASITSTEVYAVYVSSVEYRVPMCSAETVSIEQASVFEEDSEQYASVLFVPSCSLDTVMMEPESCVCEPMTIANTHESQFADSDLVCDTHCELLVCDVKRDVVQVTSCMAPRRHVHVIAKLHSNGVRLHVRESLQFSGDRDRSSSQCIRSVRVVVKPKSVSGLRHVRLLRADGEKQFKPGIIGVHYSYSRYAYVSVNCLRLYLSRYRSGCEYSYLCYVCVCIGIVFFAVY